MAEKSEYTLCSDAANLLSFICQSMRNLKKEILTQSSTPAHQDKTLAVDFFTPEQIIEAREHPSNYVKQAINAVAAIQGTLNLIQNKIDACAEHRIKIEKTLVLMLEKRKAKK
jgi:hypothetical protein